MLAFVDKDSQLVVDSLRRLQPSAVELNILNDEN